MPETQHTPMARALGRIPCGLYIVSTQTSDGPLGFVGSFVMQAGFAPPTVSVAIGKDRDHLAAIRSNGRFALSILDKASQGLMGPFFKPSENGPFAEAETLETPNGLIAMAGALAWLEARVSGEFETDDHVVVYGVVEHGETLRQGDPSVHLRSNGLSY